jgi:hypothetical protein
MSWSTSSLNSKLECSWRQCPLQLLCHRKQTICLLLHCLQAPLNKLRFHPPLLHSLTLQGNPFLHFMSKLIIFHEPFLPDDVVPQNALSPVFFHAFFLHFLICLGRSFLSGLVIHVRVFEKIRVQVCFPHSCHCWWKGNIFFCKIKRGACCWWRSLSIGRVWYRTFKPECGFVGVHGAPRCRGNPPKGGVRVRALLMTLG